MENGDPDLLATPSNERLAAAMKENRRAGFSEVVQIGYGGGLEVLKDFNVPHIRNNAWATQVDIAEIAKQFIPINYYDTNRPEGLWKWLEKTSEATGADFIAIPHNSNMSDGKMFNMVDSDGRPLSY